VEAILFLTRRIPHLYLFVGGIHVHHLNFGIILLSVVGAYLLLMRPTGRGLRYASIAYGIGLALTFDEFGMWLHLGGSYWARASFDAVVVIAAALGLLAVAPTLRAFRPRTWATTIALGIAGIVFAVLLIDSLKYADRLLLRVQVIERMAPP
jgi:uncharacterized membrane protein YeaQ/YmgE (transglycosylase-associated protein family)